MNKVAPVDVWLAVYRDRGDGLAELLGASMDPRLLRVVGREILNDEPPPGDALTKARHRVLRQMAEAG